MNRIARRRALLTTRQREIQDFWSATERDWTAYRFYNQFIKSGDIVFDVGANRGNRAKIFSMLQAFVVMVEPQSTCNEFLKQMFFEREKYALLEIALGKVDGEHELHICQKDVLSTLSSDWLSAVSGSGRFNRSDWEGVKKVRMTTLDALISQYGIPAFMKIDVEGYELEVLSGLSNQPIALSFEFTPEFITSSYECIAHLCAMGAFEFQLSLGESFCMALPKWVSDTEIKEHLSRLSEIIDTNIFGDVYARRRL